MYALFVTIYVKPKCINDFLDLTNQYAIDVRNENGNTIFDLYQSDEKSNIFYIFEEYNTKNEFLNHRSYNHSIQWKKNIEKMMDRPRERVRFNKV